MKKRYRLSKRDIDVIVDGMERYHVITPAFLMVKLKCSARKALWIVNNIQTEKDILEHKKKAKDEETICKFRYNSRYG